MSYSVNWTKTPAGNAIKEHETITVKVSNAEFVSGGVYMNNLPIIAGFGMGDTMKIKLSRKDMNLEGFSLVLKTRAWVDNRSQGWDDQFLVI